MSFWTFSPQGVEERKRRPSCDYYSNLTLLTRAGQDPILQPPLPPVEIFSLAIVARSGGGAFSEDYVYNLLLLFRNVTVAQATNYSREITHTAILKGDNTLKKPKGYF